MGTGGRSAQDVQVDGRGPRQVVEQGVDLFDVEPHVGLALPAPQHQVVQLLRTGTGSLQDATLRDALDHLRGSEVKGQPRLPVLQLQRLQVNIQQKI